MIPLVLLIKGSPGDKSCSLRLASSQHILGIFWRCSAYALASLEMPRHIPWHILGCRWYIPYAMCQSEPEASQDWHDACGVVLDKWPVPVKVRSTSGGK